jgi:hypothetical protein
VLEIRLRLDSMAWTRNHPTREKRPPRNEQFIPGQEQWQDNQGYPTDQAESVAALTAWMEGDDGFDGDGLGNAQRKVDRASVCSLIFELDFDKGFRPELIFGEDEHESQSSGLVRNLCARHGASQDVLRKDL